MFVSYLDALSGLISSGGTNIFQFVKVKAAAALKESTLHLLTFYSLKFLLMLHWTAPAPGHMQALMHAPKLIFPHFHPNPQDSHCLSRAASTVCFCCSGALQQCGQQSVSTELSLKQFISPRILASKLEAGRSLFGFQGSRIFFSRTVWNNLPPECEM